MNFKRKRMTNKETGVQVRVLDIQITDITTEDETKGIVVFCDKKNTVYMSMEKETFDGVFVDGWLDKIELGLEEAKPEPETLIEKIKDTVDELVEDTKDIIDEVKEGIDNIVEAVTNEVEETKEDIEDIVENESEEEV